MPVLLKMCDMYDSYYNESDECVNVNSNEDCSDIGLDYDEDLSEEDNYDENLMTDDEISGLIGG